MEKYVKPTSEMHTLTSEDSILRASAVKNTESETQTPIKTDSIGGNDIDAKYFHNDVEWD